MSLELSIIVPDKIFWKGSVKDVILPTLTGQMGVLKDHIPLLTGLDIGLLLIRKADSEDWVKLVVSGGFALVNNNKLTVLVNEAELGSDINVEEANQEFLSSKLAFETTSNEKKSLELSSQYKKARARVL
uniref:ATP synthase epsilon chain, chloroplastic n=1 Tax=Trachelomonas volvocina TaxID=103340 RepID=A0A0G3VQU4_9EUGL|nr:ATPase epsilon subunit [Trachelomonas volvocina]AKL82412.1 ATPase epsilon subunit [Trachelomonas volvocina]